MPSKSNYIQCTWQFAKDFLLFLNYYISAAKAAEICIAYFRKYCLSIYIAKSYINNNKNTHNLDS